MITRLELTNFGPMSRVEWNTLGPINLVIGNNGSGKTFLLKSLYTAMRTLEEFRRGDDPRTAEEILWDKLYWTFQPDQKRIGDLVTKGAADGLRFSCLVDGNAFSYGFDGETEKVFAPFDNQVPPRGSNSMFLPAKEVLSLQKIILKSREREQDFGFDDTYLDLARALSQSTTQGKNYYEFADSRRRLEDMLGGKIEFDAVSDRWRFRNTQNEWFPIGMTAEGVKKIAILDTLLGNRYLTPESIIFIDEPESALHPSALIQLLDIVATLAARGIQFFMASHSYFVVKKLFLIAQEKSLHIPVIAAGAERWRCADLKDGMPDNAIIDESIRLYEQEVNLSLK